MSSGSEIERSEVVRVERRGAAVLVGINRPDKRNAVNQAVVDAIDDVLRAQRSEPAVLIFHSTTPGMFIAGADIAELRNRRADDALQAVNAGLLDRIEAHRWPTIAAVDGAALGMGSELALACDLRIASERATFGQPETSLGVLAGAGGNWRLSQLIGVSAARRMLYLGVTYGGERAIELGLIDELVDSETCLDDAVGMADRIGRRSWRALELTKLALRLHRPTTMNFDVLGQALLFETDDSRTRMDAFLERRTKRT